MGGDALDGAAFWVEGEDAVGNETHAEAERDEVGDEVEAVGLHGGLDGEAVSGEPGAEEFAGDGFLADEEPALPGEEISQFCGGDSSTRGGKAEVGRGDGDEFVGEAMADLNGAREMRRSGDDAEVEFPAFDSAEDERAGFLAEASWFNLSVRVSRLTSTATRDLKRRDRRSHPTCRWPRFCG